MDIKMLETILICILSVVRVKSDASEISNNEWNSNPWNNYQNQITSPSPSWKPITTPSPLPNNLPQNNIPYSAPNYHIPIPQPKFNLTLPLRTGYHYEKPIPSPTLPLQQNIATTTLAPSTTTTTTTIIAAPSYWPLLLNSWPQLGFWLPGNQQLNQEGFSWQQNNFQPILRWLQVNAMTSNQDNKVKSQEQYPLSTNEFIESTLILPLPKPIIDLRFINQQSLITSSLETLTPMTQASFLNQIGNKNKTSEKISSSTTVPSVMPEPLPMMLPPPMSSPPIPSVPLQSSRITEPKTSAFRDATGQEMVSQMSTSDSMPLPTPTQIMPWQMTPEVQEMKASSNQYLPQGSNRPELITQNPKETNWKTNNDGWSLPSEESTGWGSTSFGGNKWNSPQYGGNNEWRSPNSGSTNGWRPPPSANTKEWGMQYPGGNNAWNSPSSGLNGIDEWNSQSVKDGTDWSSPSSGSNNYGWDSSSSEEYLRPPRWNSPYLTSFKRKIPPGRRVPWSPPNLTGSRRPFVEITRWPNQGRNKY